MGFLEGTKEIFKTIVKKPIMPVDGEHKVPVELVGPFTTRIPESPTQIVSSQTPDSGLPKKTDNGSDK